MKQVNKINKIIIFLLLTLVIIGVTPIFGSDFTKKIEAVLNNITLYINGEQIKEISIDYEGKTYIPLDLLSDKLEIEVEYNKENKKADIFKHNCINYVVTDGKYNILNYSPKMYDGDAYLINDFLYIQFDNQIKDNIDYSNVVFMDTKGNRKNIKCLPLDGDKTCLAIIPENCDLDTYYTVYIPKDTVEFTNGDKYQEDIQMFFKTAENILEGKLNSSDNYYGCIIKLYNNKGYEKVNYILQNNLFYFTNIPKGVYSLSVDDVIFDNIIVEDGKVNYISLMEIE